jgi:hypothetical protein
MEKILASIIHKGPRGTLNRSRTTANNDAAVTDDLVRRACLNKICDVVVEGYVLLPPGIFRRSSLMEIIACEGDGCPGAQTIQCILRVPGIMQSEIPNKSK